MTLVKRKKSIVANAVQRVHAMPVKNGRSVAVACQNNAVPVVRQCEKQSVQIARVCRQNAAPLQMVSFRPILIVD